jgi:virginiamycin B lyase
MYLALFGLGASGCRTVNQLESRIEPQRTQGSRHAPSADSMGLVWFVAENDGLVCYLDPSTKRIASLELGISTRPTALAIVDGFVVVAATGDGRMIRIDRMTHTIRRYAIPDSSGRRRPNALAADPVRKIVWFTAKDAETVGYFDPKTGAFLLWGLIRGSSPSDISVDPDGRAWYAESATNKIGMIDPRSRRSTEFLIPEPTARPSQIFATDHGVWFISGRTSLGRIDPTSNVIERFSLPDGWSGQIETLASDGTRMWVVENVNVESRLWPLDLQTRLWGSPLRLRQGERVVGKMSYDHVSRHLWFVTDSGTIGQLAIPQLK